MAPHETAKFHEHAETLLAETSDFRVLVGLASMVGRSDPTHPMTDSNDNARYENFSWQNQLLRRIQVYNQWLYSTDTYSTASPQVLPNLFQNCDLTEWLDELDEVLRPESKYWFLFALTESARLATIASYIPLAGEYKRMQLLAHELFGISLNFPVLARYAMDCFFQAFPEVMRGSWCDGELILEKEGYDRVIDLGEMVDNPFCSAARHFFFGIHAQDGRSIGSAGGILRRLGQSTSENFYSVSEEHAPLRLWSSESLLNYVHLLLERKAIRDPENGFSYGVNATSGGTEQWLIYLPQGENWFVERPLPWTRHEYQQDPLGFIRRHLQEVPKSAQSRWLLAKGDLLGGLALEVNLDNYIHGLTAMITQPVLNFGSEARDKVLSLQRSVNERLAQLNAIAQQATPEQRKFAARILADIIVDVVVLNESSVKTIVRLSAVEVVAEILYRAMQSPHEKS